MAAKTTKKSSIEVPVTKPKKGIVAREHRENKKLTFTKKSKIKVEKITVKKKTKTPKPKKTAARKSAKSKMKKKIIKKKTVIKPTIKKAKVKIKSKKAVKKTKMKTVNKKIAKKLIKKKIITKKPMKKKTAKKSKLKKKTIKRKTIIKPKTVTKINVKKVPVQSNINELFRELITEYNKSNQQQMQILRNEIKSSRIPTIAVSTHDYELPDEEIAYRMVKLYFTDIVRHRRKKALTLDEVINAYLYALTKEKKWDMQKLNKLVKR